MHERSYRADWNIPLPGNLGLDETWSLLQSLLLVNWSWDIFIWDLRELYRLLTTTPAEFNYLFLTVHLKARAAYLAATGPFDCTQKMILEGIGSNRVQLACIYYRLFISMLREILESERGAKMIGDREERLFQLAIGEVERQYIEILEMIALGEDTNATIHGHSIESWITGRELRDGRSVCVAPAPVDVRVIMQRVGQHRLVRPSAHDMVKKIRNREAMRSFMERVGVLSQTDIAIEKLSRRTKAGGYPVVKYGDMDVEYYLTLTNTEKSTLYVVCADRTMRIHQRNGIPPGCKPATIEVIESNGGGEELYLVTFDNGSVGVYNIDFRPHKHVEHEHVPQQVVSCQNAIASSHANGQWAEGGSQKTDGKGEMPEVSNQKADAKGQNTDGSIQKMSGDRIEKDGSGDSDKALAVKTSGKRFEISGDYELVVDRKKKKSYSVTVLNARLALSVFVELGIDSTNKRTGLFICEEVNKRRAALGKPEITMQPLSHLFRCRGKGSGANGVYGFYGELIMVEEHSGLYWMAL